MAPPERRSARALQLAVGVVITAALVWWAFHKVPFGEFWSTIRTANAATMFAAVVVATIPFVLRVPRWRLLLRHDDGTPIATSALWHAIAIGFAANNVLPLRAGEILRVGAVSRLGQVPFAAALSSVAVERVLDALTVAGLMGVGLVAGTLPSTAAAGMPAIAVVAQRTGILCLALLLAAIAAAWQRELALRLFERLLPRGPISAGLVQFADRLLSGISALRDPRRAVPIVAWSLVIWLINGTAFYVGFLAFHFTVPFTGALVLQGALMIGIAVPSTPGYAFVFEAAIVAALALFGIATGPAFAFAATYHLTTFVPITTLGAISAVRTGSRRNPNSAIS
ncbi:MAG: lysylphosphatidylglycerol synthase transmembrane domain-containing protein [Gemmatimonadales bacterium]